METKHQTSPYVQEKMLVLSQMLPYDTAKELMKSMWGNAPSTSSFWRCSQEYGFRLGEEHEEELSRHEEELSREEKAASCTVFYVMADGSMLFTDDGWQECKAGRMFSIEGDVPIKESVYVAHLGGHKEFIEKMEKELSRVENPHKVFVSDGAIWLKNWMDKNHPEALQILDYWHAVEHISQALDVVLSGKEKINKLCELKNLLLDSQVDKVCAELRKLAKTSINRYVIEKNINYLQRNKYRMDYKSYREAGLLIGSGAMESTHIFLIQQRMKLAGQRWSNQGGQNLLNLRCAFHSNKWHLVEKLIAC